MTNQELALKVEKLEKEIAALRAQLALAQTTKIIEKTIVIREEKIPYPAYPTYPTYPWTPGPVWSGTDRMNSGGTYQ